jgi:hypothetical protein
MEGDADVRGMVSECREGCEGEAARSREGGKRRRGGFGVSVGGKRCGGGFGVGGGRFKLSAELAKQLEV